MPKEKKNKSQVNRRRRFSLRFFKGLFYRGKAQDRRDQYPLVDPELCKKCGFKGTPLCTHPDGVYQDEPAGLNKLIQSMNQGGDIRDG